MSWGAEELVLGRGHQSGSRARVWLVAGDAMKAAELVGYADVAEQPAQLPLAI